MYTDTLFLAPQTAVPLAYAVFVTSALCYGLISFANRHCTTSTATAFWPLQVPVAILLSYLIFGDVVTLEQVGGGAMIIAGLLTVAYSNHLQEKQVATTATTSGYAPLGINDEAHS